MSTSDEQAFKEYAEFEEKVKRTLFLGNLSPQVSSSVIQTALGQFGNVLDVYFIPNYTVPYPIPTCALVEMEDPKQASAVISMITNYPFMIAGMPRPVTAQAATAEMFVDRPPPPGRYVQLRWVKHSDPNFVMAKKLKQLFRKHCAESSALVKLTLEEEEKLATHHEELLMSNYKKYEMIESVMQDGSVRRLARTYGSNLEED